MKMTLPIPRLRYTNQLEAVIQNDIK